MGKVWMIASGKGGAGKSTVASGLGVTLARHKRLTCVVDADVGLKGIDLMLGLQDSVVFDLFDAAAGECAWEQALVRHQKYPELSLLSTSQTALPDALDADTLLAATAYLRERFDYVIIDCPAGIGGIVAAAAGCADACMLVVTPDDLSLRDAERASQFLREQRPELPQHLVVNRADKRLIADALIMRPAAIADALGVPLIGEVPGDERVYRALLAHQSPAECASASVRKMLERLALRVEGGQAPFQNYWIRRKPWYRIAD